MKITILFLLLAAATTAYGASWKKPETAFASGYKCDLTTFDGRNSQLRIIPTRNKYSVISKDITLGNFKVIDNSVNFLHIFYSSEEEKLSMHIGINKKTGELIFNLMDFKIKNRPASQVNGSCEKS